ncbi:peroxide stress protein YaaA [Microbacterium sp. STN6]|uniref:YaaA family protein n=1 Tax=Microbacterium sp. STN6 TaxID=2995588 RepID=UPI002260F48A|nr:peroxide stress protein YaaA [Microbacterium sp. STN6]MCX7521179.1 peroxide stress protein YaaA [Microbacterium sp. STN6]
MLVLLPPSETKREGGDAERALDLDRLRYPSLTRIRRSLVRAVSKLAHDEAATITALRLGPRQHGEVERNRVIASAPVMPAIDRYTGVLYDALDAATLSEAGRASAERHLLIHSALFGPVGALDAIPAYRLSWDSRLPDTRLASVWAGAVSEQLGRHDGLIVDLRSEGYAKLGPLPERPDAVYVRVVSSDPSRPRPLNHFNKRSKGLFVRALMERGEPVGDADDLVAWAAQAGFTLRRAESGELHLVEVAAVSGAA